MVRIATGPPRVSREIFTECWRAGCPSWRQINSLEAQKTLKHCVAMDHTQTWELVCIPDDNSVVNAAWCQIRTIRRPGDAKYICTHTFTGSSLCCQQQLFTQFLYANYISSAESNMTQTNKAYLPYVSSMKSRNSYYFWYRDSYYFFDKNWSFLACNHF